MKELNIFKKGLYNSDVSDENELLDILNPILKSESIWKSHALYLVAEFFYDKGELQKSKDFFQKILYINLTLAMKLLCQLLAGAPLISPFNNMA